MRISYAVKQKVFLRITMTQFYFFCAETYYKKFKSRFNKKRKFKIKSINIVL